VNLLLDTHVFIWWDEGARLPAAARTAIRDADAVFVSAASGWEIAIKTSLGRLKPRRTVSEALRDSGFEELPVLLRHTETLSSLPWHHRDPFDRLLAAQALCEGLTLLTRDPVFGQYGVQVLRA
jgi:PIN domain nuclease of toxin-antitoxin system